MAQYISTRVPFDVHEKLKAKKQKLEFVGSQLLGRKVKLPITRVLRLVADYPFQLSDDYVKSLFTRRRRDGF